jgi:hypothetical protein
LELALAVRAEQHDARKRHHTSALGCRASMFSRTNSTALNARSAGACKDACPI